MDDHSIRGVPIKDCPIEWIYEFLMDGTASYNGGDPKVAVAPEHWEMLKLRLEVELVRRELGLPCR